jgi:hypothetical protein
MGSLKLKSFDCIQTGVSPLLMQPSRAVDVNNLLIKYPKKALNNNVGTSKYNTYGAGVPIVAIHQLKKHGYVGVNETLFGLNGYSDDITNRFGCNTFVFFKNSELCDFSDHKGIPLRLNDDINSFKIIYNKTL